MKLTTNAGVEINLDYIRVIDVKPGEKLVYKAPVPPVQTPEEFQAYMNNVMQGLAQVFGKEVPVLLIGPQEDFFIIKEEQITKIVALAKPIPQEAPGAEMDVANTEMEGTKIEIKS
jgi:hypothetical protein